MKIKKYRPNFFTGFEDEYFDVNSKEELLASELCKRIVDNGYEISFSVSSKEDKRYCQGIIMAIRQAPNEYGAEWWVLALIHKLKDIETLESWLPSWEELRNKYKNIKNNK